MSEPRFMLDMDSICYGCKYYKHIDKTNEPEEFAKDDIDENGGVCDCHSPCYGGHMNGYRMDD